MSKENKQNKFSSFEDLKKLNPAENQSSKGREKADKSRFMNSKTATEDLVVPNIGWLYYKNYFSSIDFSYVIKNDDIVKEKNAKEIKNNNQEIVRDTSLVVIEDGLGEKEQNIELKINYPGLVTGIGFTHEAGVEGEFKLGLHFDHTNGVPIIHGSSVKGLLRSAFPDYNKNDKYTESKHNFIIHLLTTKNLVPIPVEKNKQRELIRQIEKEIFEGINAGEKRINIYNRDIFFDAILILADKKNRVVETDALAPHGDKPLKNPIPLPFLKISSGCTIRFRFSLKKGKFLSAIQKMELFKQILLTLGIGAKTNVGYGQFEGE